MCWGFNITSCIQQVLHIRFVGLFLNGRQQMMSPVPQRMADHREARVCGYVPRQLLLLLTVLLFPLVLLVTDHRDRRKSIPIVVAVERVSCVADFAPCGGGVLSPVKAKCCNPLSSCFRRGRYFSQCRPRSSVPATLTSPGGRLAFEKVNKHSTAAICAPDFGICAAGIGSDSSIPCCHGKTFHCTLSTPFFHQCLPEGGVKRQNQTQEVLYERGETHAWFPQKQAHAKFSYMPISQAVAYGIPLVPLTVEDKLRPLAQLLRQRFSGNPWAFVHRNALLRAVVPSLSHTEVAEILASLHLALPSGAKPFKEREELVVRFVNDAKAADVWDASMALAAVPYVRELHYGV